MTRVLLFAQARELAGTREVTLDAATVTDVLGEAREKFGAEFGDLAERCTIIVDDEVVHRSEQSTRGSGSEMAILPPVSGGSGEPTHVSPLDIQLRVAVLTISDRASRGDYEDLTGPVVEELVTRHLGAVVVEKKVVADDREVISRTLIELCDRAPTDDISDEGRRDHVDLVITNGGTGLGPRDVTPEATRDILDIEAPGISELMRFVGFSHTPLAALARQVCGRRGTTVVINLPGSKKAATECLEAVIEVLPHACAVARSGWG